MDIIKFQDNIYINNFIILFNCDISEFGRYVHKKYGVPEDELIFTDSSTSGRMIHIFNANCDIYIIWLKNFKWLVSEQSLLIHELWHCIYAIFKNRGIIISDNDEGIAYYLQYLFKSAYNQLRKKG